MRRTPAFLATTILIAGVALAPPAASGAAAHSGVTPDSLYRRACARAAQPAIDQRVAALADFEEACRLAPERADLWLALGNACIESGRFGRARQVLRKVTALTASDQAWLQLGRAWQHDWLISSERSSLDEAVSCFTRARTIAPTRAEAWTAEAALRLMRGQAQLALAAAVSAGDADPDGAEPLLMMAAACYRAGLLAEADASFNAALPRVSRELRRRLEGDVADDAPAGPPREADGEDPAATIPIAFSWEGSDPDLTTPENEALLDYRTRVALAAFLFRVGDSIHWDRRAELFARYGPPASIDFNPAGAQHGPMELNFAMVRRTPVMYAPDPLPFPFDMQVWIYPDLNLVVPLWDRSLSQHYEFPVSEDRDLDPQPDPAWLAHRDDLVMMAGGRGVFHTMPPGATVVPVTAAVSRFPEADGSRVLAHVFALGSPSDTLWGSWALVDSTGAVVAQGSRNMTVSACDPGAQRVAEFAAPVAPGEYRLDLSVRGAHGRRGLAHRLVRIESTTGEAPRMSDLVLVCGDSPSGVADVRIQPQTMDRVMGRSMRVYFELDRLATDAAGTARFAVTWSVLARRQKPKRRDAEPLVEVTREEQNQGPHRRQFVTVPMARLDPGSYELRVEVRDLSSGERVAGTLPFSL